MKTFNDGIDAALAVIAEMQDGHLTPDLTSAYRNVESLKELTIVSLNQRRVEKTHNANDWLALDAINDAKNKIQNENKEPTVCIVSWAYIDENGTSDMTYVCKSTSKYVTLGLLTHVMKVVNK